MKPEAATLASGSVFEDRYEIEGELGAGSFGRVYRARQRSTGQSVAIKLLSAREGTESSTGREAERFRRETRICAALSHPNIVPLIDSGETADGRLYAVFAHVPGETLAEALEREGAVGVGESVRLMTQVLDALAAAHAQGIVHRDLKPANLMLSGTGARRNALVLDFGLGGLAEGRRRQHWQTITQSREFLGTPLYAAPEQLAGDTPTERSDLYAWGLVFLECLTGEHPFAGEGAVERLLTGGGVVEIPEWLQGHALGALLAQVTARDAEKRDVSVETMIEALDRIGRSELPVTPETAPTPAPLAESGERRHLTVMFCDLVGSTALAQQLAAEAYREVVRAYQARAAAAVERYGGTVAQYLGDGLLVYFGYPHARENDAERAVRAGREVLREVEMLRPRLASQHEIEIAVRLGIHTGPVVVGEVGGGEKRETLALGGTPNLAARLQELAEAGELLISEATRRLVAGLFITEDRGFPVLKGISEPIRVHRVVQSSGGTSRLDRAPTLTPFVGREEELGLLWTRFQRAAEGQGQAVLIAGEAGIGKSRLVLQLRERLREAPHSWLECRSSPYTEKSAFHPVIELLEQALDFSPAATAEEKLERLERGLAHAGMDLSETVPLFAGLLSLRLPDRYPPLEISPQLQRQKTLAALLAWLLALGEQQPVVLLVEDLHWIDPSTLEWLGLLIEQCPTASVLLLLTFRPEFDPPWLVRAHLLLVTLSRLSRQQARQLVTGAVSKAHLSDALVEAIAERADGVPLFAEELAKDVVDSGAAPDGTPGALAIPETLQDSLMARLDRLGEAKPVAQIGAAIGREFPYALLEAVAPLTPAALEDGLARLVASELVYQRGLKTDASYTFKHALVQDEAYASLLEGQRREIHGRIADALEKQFPERIAREPELVARHCEEAGRTVQAIEHYRRAGKRAAQRFARDEAIVHLHRAVELLYTLSESAERNEQELQLQIELGAPLIAAKGYSDREVERVHARARELCQELREGVELCRALIGLSMFHYVRGELQAGQDLAEQALAMAERAGESFPLLVAHTRLGINLWGGGRWTRALEHLQQAVALYDPAEHRTHAAAWGQDWGIVARSFAAWTTGALGYPDQARHLMRETVELARQGDPYGLAFALQYDGALHIQLRDRGRAREGFDEAIAIARARGFPGMLAGCLCDRGWAVGGPQGIGEIERGLDMLAALKQRLMSAHCQANLVELYLEEGRIEDAVNSLERIDSRSANPFRLYELRAQLLWQQDPKAHAEEVERCHRRGLEIARMGDAKLYELRVAARLARLLHDQRRSGEARALLEPVYDWFTEGFDTQDLKDAKALLEELA